MFPRHPTFLVGVTALVLLGAVGGAVRGREPAGAEKDSKPKPATDEPPLEFVLTLDGKAVDVRADEPVRVRVGDREVELRLTAKPERTLKVPGLSFRYPAGHGFEVERSEESSQWTLDGNDNVVILNRLGHRADPAEMTRGTVARLGASFERGNARETPSQMRLGGRAYPSTRLAVTIASERLTYEICAFNAGGATFVVMVQDSPKADGSTSDETRRVMELLDKTLVLEE